MPQIGDSFKKAILIDKDFFDRISGIFSEPVRAEVTIHFADKSSDTYDSFEKVLRLNNAGKKTFKNLEINLYGTQIHCSLKFKKLDRFGDNIWYYVSAPEETISCYQNKIFEYIATIQQPFSRVYFFDWSVSVLMAFMGLIIYLIGLKSDLIKHADKILVISCAIFLFFFFFFSLHLVTKLQLWLMPKTVFSFADGARQYSNIVKIRHYIGGTLILGIICKLLFSMFHV